MLNAGSTIGFNDGFKAIGHFCNQRCRMKFIPIAATLAVALGVALSGCATVTRSSSTNWTVSSLPAGAEVRISNGDYCAATPCSFHVRRKDPFIATLSTPGYEPGTVEVKPE